MQAHNGCEFLFPTDSDIGFLMVPTRMGVLKPSSNDLNLLPHEPLPEGHAHAHSSATVDRNVALTTQCYSDLWQRRFGHLNMQCLQAQHTHGVPTTPALPGSAKHVPCDSCLRNKATAAPNNTTACTKLARPS
jgi:hypothetical protein